MKMLAERKQRLELASIVLNLLLFLIAFAWYPPVWATNDDYRMSVILSGAYLGEPSADAVFLQYPLGVLLSWLYGLFPTLPIYGIYTELTLFISCCVICYAILDVAQRNDRLSVGLLLYLVLYLVALKKYTIMPQFTLTSTYMGIAAAVLVWRMPQSTSKAASAVCAALLSLFAFLTRAKAFYLLIPVIGVIIIGWWLTNKRICRRHVLYVMVTGITVLVSLAVNTVYWMQPDYAAYKEFNTARSRVYDYGDIPFFYDDQGFYVSNGIDETLYRQIAARYLDMDPRLTAETLNTVADRIEEVTNGSQSPVKRVVKAYTDSLGSWFSSTDKTVAYSAAFVLIFLAIYSVLTFLRVQNVNEDSTRLPQGLFIIIFAGLFLENTYFLYIGRLMTRQIDTLLITAAVLGSVMVLELAGTHQRSFCCCHGRSLADRLLRGTALLAAFAVGLAGIAGASIALSKNHAAALNRNAKLETMWDYASANPDSFYFYDTQEFISATDDVFQVYDISRPLNAESLGNWNVGSPTYLKRNKMMGFTSAIEGLTQCDNVYFVAITEPRLVTTRTLKDHYNKKLVMVDKIQASNCTLYVYCVMDAD
ncbi:MAG: hypothetical protein Q4E72_05440 [bacterium]|nr:hypothetical protein [bacterium]